MRQTSPVFTNLLYTAHCAFLRRPAKSIVNGISQDASRQKPDPMQFMQQYGHYVDALKSMGLAIHICDADEKFPDGNFVEDTHLILDADGERVMIELNPGAQSRADEPISLREFLPSNVTKHVLDKRFTIDGGDILEDRKTLYVGLSARTQQGAIDNLTQIAAQYGYRVHALRVPEGLHLKSGMTCMLPGHFIIQASFERILKDLQREDASIQYFIVPSEESYAANVLPTNGKIMIPAGCPQTKDYIAQFYAPENILEVDTSQARLVDGALTCSSLLM
jgi:dimethylargininase